MGTVGTLAVTDTYSDPLGGNIAFQLVGPNSMSLLDVTGAASLTGSMFDVSQMDGFQPTSGEIFEIMTSAGLGVAMFMNPIFQVGNLTCTASYINADYREGKSTNTPWPDQLAPA